MELLSKVYIIFYLIIFTAIYILIRYSSFLCITVLLGPSLLIASWRCFATLRAKNRAVTGTGCGIAIILPLCKIMYNLSMCYYFQEKAFYNRLVSYIFLPVLNNWKIIPIHTYVNLYVHMFACYVVYSISMSTVSVKKSSLGCQ